FIAMICYNKRGDRMPGRSSCPEEPPACSQSEAPISYHQSVCGRAASQIASPLKTPHPYHHRHAWLVRSARRKPWNLAWASPTAIIISLSPVLLALVAAFPLRIL